MVARRRRKVMVKLEIIKKIQKSCLLFKFFILNNNILQRFCSLKFKKSLNSNKFFSFIFRSKMIEDQIKYFTQNQLIIHENEATEPHINNRMNNNVDEYTNAFNNNIDNNVTIHKRRPTPVINRFPQRDTIGVSKQSKNFIPGYINTMKQFVLVGQHCVRYKYRKGHQKK